MTFNRNNTRTNIFTWLWPASLVTLLTPRGRTEGQGQGQRQGETTFSFSFIVYREILVWGLKIGFRGVIFSGSGCIY